MGANEPTARSTPPVTPRTAPTRIHLYALTGGFYDDRASTGQCNISTEKAETGLMKLTSASLAILLLALWPVEKTTRDRWTALMKQGADALGGEARVRGIHAIEVDGVSAQYQREQSERPEGPWVVTYSDFAD